jgi:hypothetical protein
MPSYPQNAYQTMSRTDFKFDKLKSFFCYGAWCLTVPNMLKVQVRPRTSKKGNPRSRVAKIIHEMNSKCIAICY